MVLVCFPFESMAFFVASEYVMLDSQKLQYFTYLVLLFTAELKKKNTKPKRPSIKSLFGKSCRECCLDNSKDMFAHA